MPDLNRVKSNAIKSISEPSDLALHGSQPAFAEALHVGRPNVGSRDAFLELVDGIFDRNWLTNDGPLVRRLEGRIASELGVKHCVAMTNGTIALEIMIRALDLEGEVIVPSYTFIATAHALQWQSITPVFADIDPSTHNLDVESVRKAITPRTTGILATHLWGNHCEVDELQALADEHGLHLIFDAAHAFMSGKGGRVAGGFGRAEAFSFHATKFFNAFEGGAVTTNDDELAQKLRLMRNFGFAGTDNVVHPGTNGKMSEVCAAMGLVNLDQIQTVVAVNKRNYLGYRAALEPIDGISVLTLDTEASNFQYVVVEVGEQFPVGRDEIVKALEAENVLARRYFWPGCHNMLPYRQLFPDYDKCLPNTNLVANRVIVLPTGTALPDGAITVVRSVIEVLSRQTPASK